MKTPYLNKNIRENPPPVFISDFKTVSPKFSSKQKETLEWLTHAHTHSISSQEKREKIKKEIQRFATLCNHIGYRKHELEDYSLCDRDSMRIFGVHSPPSGAGMRVRMNFYAEAMHRIFDELYPVHSDPPGALVHVTCTGYLSPNEPQKLIERRMWPRDVCLLNVYHMGCYAAFPSLRIAWGLFSQLPNRPKIDIVHTELCSLHLDPTQHSPEQILLQCLFADGFARYTLTQEKPENRRHCLKLKFIHDEIIPGTLALMEWIPGDFGMQMTLSKKVPSAILEYLPTYLNNFTLKSQFQFNNKIAQAVFAIHPGGPKIIESIQKLLKLSDEQVRISRKVLYERGNMSSATLPHIWKEMAEDSSIPTKTPIISLAFGPGLTIYGAILEKV